MNKNIRRKYQALPLALLLGLTAVRTANGAPLLPVHDTYIKAVYSLPLTLDPVLMNDTASLVAGNLIYEGLLRFSPTLKIEAALAESWATSADGKVLTFTLRKNARFHNGDSITADDVVASLKRALSPGSQVRKYYDCIDELHAADPQTVVIRLKHPFPPFLSILAGVTAKVLPRKLLADSKFFQHPVGSGPFQFIARVKEPYQQIELDRFEAYYRGPARIGRFILRELTEVDSTRAATAGDVDDLANWPLTASDPVFRAGKNVSGPLASTWIIGINTRASPFASLAVRSQFKRDVDTDGFRKTFYPDAFPANGYVPPGLPGYAREPGIAPDASVPPPKDLIRLVIPKELTRSEEMRSYLETGLRSKGWTVNVLTMEWAQLMKGYDQKSHQAFLVAMNLDYPDAEFLLRNFESSNPDNFSGIHNAELDQLLMDARSLQDRAKRQVLYRRAIQLVNHEAITVNLFHPRANYWISNCVAGFEPNILADVYIDYAKVSFKPECARKQGRQ